MRTFRHLSKLNNGSREMGEVRARVKLTNALDEALARRHQLAPDQVRVHEADASQPFIAEIDGMDTLEEAMILGDEVILGQTVLEKLDLVVDCVGQRLIPNPAHPDGPVFRI